MLILLLLCVFATGFPSPDNDDKNNDSIPSPLLFDDSSNDKEINNPKPAITFNDSTSNITTTLAPTPLIQQGPCSPSPCGPNSQCSEISGQAVCSCVQGYIGRPPSCRPECVMNSDCPSTEACINQKCLDPCPGVCGLSANCSARNHSPICSCPSRYTGNPFVQCRPIIEDSVRKDPVNPCQPSPCGPNAVCREIGDSPSCSCLTGFIGSPPYCRLECISNSECASKLACINNKCTDPCPNSCAQNAECRVVNHSPMCYCIDGYVGDPFTLCTIQQAPVIEISTPCIPNPCGANANCIDQKGVSSCQCLPEFYGNPYDGCRPECVLNSDCPTNEACIQTKCKDPCAGSCSENAECKVINHAPSCTCRVGYTGDSYQYCSVIDVIDDVNPCIPSPCGPNSQCRELNGQAVCSCLSSYIGSPPTCRPECVVSSDCVPTKACVNQKCADPCQGVCGDDAVCRVNNYSPICSCRVGFTGNPFSRCYPIPQPVEATPQPSNPCHPTPCGPNSHCQTNGNVPICSCLANYFGAPPNCHAECSISSDCSDNKACINEKCRDPCVGACGIAAKCHVKNHSPICTCNNGFTGNPFTICNRIPPTPPDEIDPCYPSPCGPNSQCRDVNGVPSCSCLPTFIGAPPSCRPAPECTINSECRSNQACINKKCLDPCPGSCGIAAQCSVMNHTPFCSCLDGYQGDPFTSCELIPPRNWFFTKLGTLFLTINFYAKQEPIEEDPCNPSPCGSNAVCNNGICTCLAEYQGDPYVGCRLECVVNSHCPRDRACLRSKCVNPCSIEVCAQNATCEVVSHIPMCRCPPGFDGNALVQCRSVRSPVVQNPCRPSPCGPNSQCSEINDRPVCSCALNYLGSPPTCHPECTVNSDCPFTQACSNQKCRDPCTGTCGIGAKCVVVVHNPICSCPNRYTGNPFVICQPIIEQPIQGSTDPCQPSPCGPNAECKAIGDSPSCSCLPQYYGNPYEGCRPECVVNSDCPSNKACIRNICQNPCDGTCGQNADCQVMNHVPSCTCKGGYIGDPFTHCTIPKDER